ncbi:MAG: ferritin family protein [Planctomycetota bacterium]
MAYLFNADEIFLIAEQIERNGVQFYGEAARRFPPSRVLFLQLAQMEENHLKRFQELHKEVTEREAEALAADPDQSAAQYLQAAAGGKVFNMAQGPAVLFQTITTARGVIEKAISLEKDSIVFYLAVKEMVAKASGRDRIDVIIREEMGHITALTDHLSRV